MMPVLLWRGLAIITFPRLKNRQPFTMSNLMLTLMALQCESIMSMKLRKTLLVLLAKELVLDFICLI